MCPDSVVRYRCPHCGREYVSRADAAACEARGPVRPLPAGLIFQQRHGSEGFSDAVFYAICEGHQRAATRFAGTHDFDYTLWAARDNGKADLLGTEVTGGYAIAPHGIHQVPNHEHPAFWRLVAWLDAQGIEATVWDGEKAVPLSPEWIRRQTGRS